MCDLEDRIKRIMEIENIDRQLAELTIDRRDKARSQYFKKVFNVEDGDKPGFFHLTLNTSIVDLEFAADTVVAALQSLREGEVGALS